MIRGYRNPGTQHIAYGENTKEARRILPRELHKKAQIWLAVLDSAKSLDALKSPGLRLEKLVGERRGQWSIRINSQYRICFCWEVDTAFNVEIVDYH